MTKVMLKVLLDQIILITSLAFVKFTGLGIKNVKKDWLTPLKQKVFNDLENQKMDKDSIDDQIELAMLELEEQKPEDYLMNATELKTRQQGMMNKGFRLSVSVEKEKEVQANQMNTLAINSLILDQKESDDIKVCCPKSLIAWQKRHKYKPAEAFSECTVDVPEPQRYINHGSKYF